MLLIIIKIKISETNDVNFIFENTIDELSKIILFTQGYKEDIKNIFNIYIEITKYFNNIEDYICLILKENIIKYDTSVNNNYTKIVNITFFNLIESLSRSILLYSIELIKSDLNKFFEFFNIFKSIEANLQKFNKKFCLFSKKLYNIRAIIKIKESYKYNYEEFEKNYEKIIKIYKKYY